MEVGDRPADHHTFAVETIGVGQDRSWRGFEGASGPRGEEKEPENSDYDQESANASGPLREGRARAAARHKPTLTGLQHQSQALNRDYWRLWGDS